MIYAQTYTAPVAIERMRAGNCPECGSTPESHTDDVHFWIPRSHDCSLLPHGVVERIDYQRQLDQIEEPPGSAPDENCGARVHVDGTQWATCTDHGLGHHDPQLDISWPAGEGPLVGQFTTRVIAWDRTPSDPCQASTPGCSIDHNRDPGDCEPW